MKESVQCDICSRLEDVTVARSKDGIRLPDVVGRLQELDGGREKQLMDEGVKEFQIVKVCPICGQKYLYEYYHDSSPGPGEEIMALTKVDKA